jgi:hypothetical protein
MRPGPTAPCSLAGLLAVFRPCFTAPTFQTFVGLVVGLIAQTRHRTVCGMLTGAGLDQVWHHVTIQVAWAWAGDQGFPLMASRSAERTSTPCLRAVEM